MIVRLQELKEGVRVKFNLASKQEFQIMAFENSYNHFDNGSYRVAKLKQVKPVLKKDKILLRRISTAVYLIRSKKQLKQLKLEL